MTALFACLVLAVALVAGGAVAAFMSHNAVKRLAAVLVALTGAALVLALLQTPPMAVLAVVAVGFGYVVLGTSIAVRLQEAYGTIEAGDADAADQQDERPEPRA